MQSNSGSIVHSLYAQNKNFRPYKHLNDVYLCSCKKCADVSFYAICFCTLKSCNYWTSQTVMIVSLRMEEHFIINVTQTNTLYFLFAKEIRHRHWPCKSCSWGNGILIL